MRGHSKELRSVEGQTRPRGKAEIYEIYVGLSVESKLPICRKGPKLRQVDQEEGFAGSHGFA